MPRTSAVGLHGIPGLPTSNPDGPWRLPPIQPIVRDPDPKSRVAYARLIGYSPTAGFVLTVILDPEDSSGVTAWKSRGGDLREYLERKEQRS
jgi:hypothetical protein